MPAAGRPRGVGSLWAMGLNYSLTGVFYNKTLAAKIGMTAAPKTLAQLDALLAKAKAAGVTPIVQFNGGETGGLLFPLQQLMGAYGPPGADQQLDLPEAGRDHRHAVEPQGGPAPAAVDQGRLLQQRRQCHRLLRR